MKKALPLVIIIVLAFAICLPTVAFADMGPKPSVTVVFDGMPSNYYATLIAPKEEWIGPHLPYDELVDEDKEWLYPSQALKNVAQKFADYADVDGYLFGGDIFDNTDEQMRYGYYPPSTFKVLVYFPSTDTLAVTEKVDAYAFESYFKVTFEEDGLRIKKTPNTFMEIVGFFLRLLFTVAIELGIAFVFRYKDSNQMGLISAINGVTQVILNIVLAIVLHNSGAMIFIFAYVIAELLVFAIEAVLFALFLNKIGPHRPAWKHVAYAFVANLVSLLLGFGISALISLVPNIII